MKFFYDEIKNKNHFFHPSLFLFNDNLLSSITDTTQTGTNDCTRFHRTYVRMYVRTNVHLSFSKKSIT